MSRVTKFVALSRKNRLMAEVLDRIEAILDSTPWSSDDILMLLDCLREKYRNWQ